MVSNTGVSLLYYGEPRYTYLHCTVSLETYLHTYVVSPDREILLYHSFQTESFLLYHLRHTYSVSQDFILVQPCTVEPPNKGHLGTSHFVLRWEAVLFSEVKNELLLWERGPEVCPLSGGCLCLGGSFIGGSTVCTHVHTLLYTWEKPARVYRCWFMYSVKTVHRKCDSSTRNVQKAPAKVYSQGIHSVRMQLRYTQCTHTVKVYTVYAYS